MMRKFSIALLFILATTVAGEAQQVIYSQTFENTASLFQDYVLSNIDKANPAGTEWDTLQSVAWFVTSVETSTNHAAVATSNYAGDTAANDWFVTPAIRIGKASKLSWKTMELTSGTTDTYEVYVSTTEQSVAGCLFNGVAGSYISNISTAFETKTLDLAAAGYANQTVYIGFRLKTPSGGDKIAVDDILVTEDSTHFVSLKFIVNMTNYIADSLFSPRTDTVDLAGNFNNFVGTKHILSIVPGSDSSLYSITIPGFLDGDRLEFKFRINSTWNDSTVEFPFGQPNRVWIIEHDKYTYTCFYNDQGTTFGISENSLMNQVNIYPNPAHESVAVETPGSISKVLLLSMNGGKILDRGIPSGNAFTLDVSSLPKGTYLLLFYTKQGFTGSRKLIKD